MKFKPGDEVVIANVPLRAKRVGVQVGMPATVEGIEDETPATKRYLEGLGLTRIKIWSFTFWWLESDLDYRH